VWVSGPSPRTECTMTYMYALIAVLAFMATRNVLGVRKAAKAYTAALERKKATSTQ